MVIIEAAEVFVNPILGGLSRLVDAGYPVTPLYVAFLEREGEGQLRNSGVAPDLKHIETAHLLLGRQHPASKETVFYKVIEKLFFAVLNYLD